MIALTLASMGNGVNQLLQSESKNEALFVDSESECSESVVVDGSQSWAVVAYRIRTCASDVNHFDLITCAENRHYNGGGGGGLERCCSRSGGRQAEATMFLKILLAAKRGCL